MYFTGDWVTTGWGHGPKGWIELGHSSGVASTPAPVPPELPIHSVAAYLNRSAEQRLLEALRDFCSERNLKLAEGPLDELTIPLVPAASNGGTELRAPMMLLVTGVVGR